MNPNEADEVPTDLFIGPGDHVSLHLKPREEHQELANLLQRAFGDGLAGMLLALGVVMTEIGTAELLKIAKEAGTHLGYDDAIWPEHPSCINRAIDTGKLMLEAFRIKRAAVAPDDEEAREAVETLVDQFLKAPDLPGTNTAVLGPLLLPILLRSNSRRS